MAYSPGEFLTARLQGPVGISDLEFLFYLTSPRVSPVFQGGFELTMYLRVAPNS